MFFRGKNFQIESVHSSENGACTVSVNYGAAGLRAEFTGEKYLKVFSETLKLVLLKTSKSQYVDKLNFVGSSKKAICKNVDKQLTSLIINR